MQLTRTYGYRLQYSAQEFTQTLSMELDKGTPRSAVNAEAILLGLKVRLGVLVEVYEAGVMDGDELYENLNGSFFELMRGAQREMGKLKGKDGEYSYIGHAEYISDMRYVKSVVDKYMKVLEEEE